MLSLSALARQLDESNCHIANGQFSGVFEAEGQTVNKDRELSTLQHIAQGMILFLEFYC